MARSGSDWFLSFVEYDLNRLAVEQSHAQKAKHYKSLSPAAQQAFDTTFSQKIHLFLMMNTMAQSLSQTVNFHPRFWVDAQSAPPDVASLLAGDVRKHEAYPYQDADTSPMYTESRRKGANSLATSGSVSDSEPYICLGDALNRTTLMARLEADVLIAKSLGILPITVSHLAKLAIRMNHAPILEHLLTTYPTEHWCTEYRQGIPGELDGFLLSQASVNHSKECCELLLSNPKAYMPKEYAMLSSTEPTALLGYLNNTFSWDPSAVELADTGTKKKTTKSKLSGQKVIEEQMVQMAIERFHPLIVPLTKGGMREEHLWEVIDVIRDQKFPAASEQVQSVFANTLIDNQISPSGSWSQTSQMLKVLQKIAPRPIHLRPESLSTLCELILNHCASNKKSTLPWIDQLAKDPKMISLFSDALLTYIPSQLEALGRGRQSADWVKNAADVLNLYEPIHPVFSKITPAQIDLLGQKLTAIEVGYQSKSAPLGRGAASSEFTKTLGVALQLLVAPNKTPNRTLAI